MKNSIYYIIALCLLYIYLHNPILSFTGLGALKFLYLFLPFLILPQVRCLIKSQKRVLYSFIAITFFGVFRTLLGGDSTYIYTSIIACIEVFIIPIILLYVFAKWNIDITKALLGVAAISCLITVVSLFNPSFHSLIRGLMVEDEILEKRIYRGYGLSEGLTYAYGIILGMIGGFSLPYLSKYKWFMLFLPLIILSIMVNARTGMLIFGGCIGVYLISNYKIGLKLLFILSVIGVILSYTPITFSLSDIAFEEEYTAIFIEEFFNQLSDTFLGTDKAMSSTTDTLFKEMIVWPNSLDEWIIGRGESIFLGAENSDIGYILQLNYGGLVYLLLVIVLLCQLLKQIDSVFVKSILILTFLVANIKGEFVINSGGFRLFVLICYVYGCDYCNTCFTNKYISK